MQFGFAILSHANPNPLLRLTKKLQQLYDSPAIACHHDFSQTYLSEKEFPNVSFVHPCVKTRWGTFSLVEAGLQAIKLLYATSKPDWFFLLSAADYPVKVAKKDDFVGVQALLDYREVEKPWLPKNPALAHYDSDENHVVHRGWYVDANLWVPILRRGPRIGRYTFQFNIPSPFSPFHKDFRCYYGDQWFAGSADAAEILLHPKPEHRALQRYLRLRSIPDECYYHTVLANSKIVIDRDTRRFSQWNGGGAHPKILEMSDLSKVISSNAHFARKFAPGSPILDELDRLHYPG